MADHGLFIKIVSTSGETRTVELTKGGRLDVNAGDRLILFGPDADKAQLDRSGGDLLVMMNGEPFFTLGGYYDLPPDQAAEVITDPAVAATYLTGEEGGLPLLTTPPAETAGPAPAETDTPQVDLVQATNPELPGNNAAARAWQSDDDIQLDSAGYSASSFSYQVQDELILTATAPAPAPAEAPATEAVNLPPYFTTVSVTTDADGNITAMEANRDEAVEEYSFQQYEYVWPYQNLLPGTHPDDETGDGAGGVPTYYSRYNGNDLSESNQEGGAVTGWGFSPNYLLGFIGVADPENDPLTVEWENGQATITDPSGTAIYQISVSFGSDITLTPGESSLVLITVLDANGDPQYENVYAVMSFMFDPDAPGFWAAYYDYDGEGGIADLFGLTDQFTTFISVGDAYHGPVQVPVNLEILDVNEAPLFEQDYYALNPHETGPPSETTEAADGPDPLSDPPEGYSFYVGNVHADDPDWLDQAQYGGQVQYQFALDLDGDTDSDGSWLLKYVGDQGDTLGWRPELLSQLNADGRLWIDPETGDIYAADDAWDLVSHTYNLDSSELVVDNGASMILTDGESQFFAAAALDSCGGTDLAFTSDDTGLHVVGGYENGNEGIDADDKLTITFDGPVLLTSMDLSDFFVGTSAEDMEWGKYTLVSASTGTEVEVYFESNSMDGDYTYLFEHTGYVSSISFEAAWLGEGVTSDYILGALSFQEVPDDIDTAYVVAHDGRDRNQDIYDQDGNLVYDADRIYSDAWDAASVDVASPEAPDDKAVLNDQHHYVYEGNMSPSFWLGDTVDLDGQTVTYTITAGNDDGIWSVYIGSDGMAYLGTAGSSAYALDYETLPNQYNLTIEVTDGDYVDDATITVDVFNVDPYFDSSIIYGSFDEGTDGSETTNGYIAKFVANDPLTNPYGGDLIYGLENDYDGLFTIDAATGEVLATRALDYETDQHSYDLTVWVSDNSTGANEHDDTYSFTININNLAPDLTFDPASTITVNEGTTGDLYSALGSDPGNPDAEPNDPTLVYSITGIEYDDGGTWTDGSAYSGYFSIDTQTGQVVQAQALDYETQPTSFRINIEVSDDGQGTGGLIDSDYLYVNVANVGPSINNIADYNFAETDAADLVVGTAVGSDPMNSAGDPNMYYWLDNDYSGKFTIDHSTGEIRATGEFDYESGAHSYDLTVLVSDTGGQSTDAEHIASTDFTVNIDNVDPEFANGTYGIDAWEGTYPRMGVFTFSAYDPATAAHSGDLFYAIASDPGGLFSIDSTTGQLYLEGTVDYETLSSYKVIISVSDNSTGSYEVDDTIAIDFDVANKAPSMDAPTLTSLDEGTTGVIGTAVATDPGNPATEPNDEVLVYSITGVYYLDGGGDKVYGQYDDFFQINQQTGEIILDQALDYENDPTELYLDIQASDDGLGTGGLTKTVTSKYTQTNVAPTLETIADVHVDEQDSGDVFIADASATDPLNASDGPPLVYSLANNYGGVFTINADTGEIHAHGSLDFESTYSYGLEVLVSDGTDSDSQTFTVYIDDVDAEIHGVEMLNQGAMEGESGMVIAQVNASDPGGGYLNYDLVGQSYGAFEIDNNGQVTLYGPVDYEHGPYELTVGVNTVGGGGYDDEITFYYTPANVDPILTLNHHDDTLTEGAYLSEQIADVTAFDPETDAFGGDLYYNLANTYGGLFEIDHRTGVVTANGDFDYETLIQDDTTFSLKITVSDNSTGGYEVDDFVEFDLTITNQAGALSVNTATDSIAEGTHDHLLLGNAYGWDPLNDPYLDGLSYQLANDYGGRFEIDQSDGSIYFTGSFNYEALPEDQRDITIQVQLVDGDGVCDTEQVTFSIDNVAVQMDYIDQTVYSINEGNFSGQIAQAFGADPLDSAHGSYLTYSLDDTYGGRFSIDSTTGVISANGSFDYETTPSYSLEVIVSDGTTVASETIEVDIANRAPYITYVWHWNFLDEGEYSDYRMADFDASDPAGGDITYSLVDDYDGLLTIDSATGEVFLTGALDYENGPHTYKLDVEASDGELSRGFHVDITFVVHNVAVDADHLDILDSSVDEGYFSGQIAQAFGDDPVNDAHDGTLSYSLVNTFGGLFSIDEDTGVVSAHGDFDYETRQTYHLEIEVSDGETTDSFNFDFDINNVAPEVSSKYSEWSLSEGEYDDYSLFSVVGSDPAGGTLTYSLANTFGGRFKIDSSTGEIFADGDLDYETGPTHYSLEIRVSDGDLTDSVTVDIYVTNLGPDIYVDADGDQVADASIEVTEGYTGFIGTAVGSDPADPTSEPNNIFLTYQIAGVIYYDSATDSWIDDGTYDGYVSIDNQTGEITLNQAMDYETGHTALELTIEVTDGEYTDDTTYVVNIANDPSDDPQVTGMAFMGAGDSDHAGFSAAGLGQYNGLGGGDFVFGAPGGEGTVYVAYGNTSWTAGDKSTLPDPMTLSPGGFTGIVIHGQSAGDQAGWAVAGAGDLNHDGKQDLIIGAIGADTTYQPDDVWTPSHQTLSFASANRSTSDNNYILNDFMWNSDGTALVDVTVEGYEGSWDRDVTWDSGDNSFGINGMDGPDDEIDGKGFWSEHMVFTFSDAVDISGFFLTDMGSQASGSAILHLAGGGTTTVSFGNNVHHTTFALTAVNQIEFYTDGWGHDSYAVAGFYGGGTFVEQNPVVVEDVGAAYVVFGSASMSGSQLDLSDNLGNNGFKIIGEEAGGHLGWAVSGAGRFNGDAYSDIVVSAPHTGSNAGSVYFIWGQASASAYGDLIDVASLGSDGFKVVGAAAGDLAGYSLATADLNDDGVGEVLIGAPGHGAGDAGAAYVLFGDAAYYNNQANQGKDLDDIVADGKATKIVGEDDGDWAGWDVSEAGDINGDGIDDIIIGAPDADGGAGAAYVIFGDSVLASAGATIDLDNLDGSNGFKITGNAGDELGYSVAAAGDVNGDGIDDIIVGSPGADNDTGEAVVIFGDDDGDTAWSDDGVIDVDDILADPEIGVILEGEDQGDRAGQEVSGAGDTNGDGVDDVVVSAPEADGDAGAGDEGGEAYLILGSTDLTGAGELEISEVVDQAA